MGVLIKVVFALLLIFQFNAAYCQADSVSNVQSELVGKLISYVPQAAGCGYITWAAVAEFELIGPGPENILSKRIPVRINCPELFGKMFFMPGEVYKITTTSKPSFKGTITDDDKATLQKYLFDQEFWAVSIEKN